MAGDALTPNTSLAILQSTQSDSAGAAQKLKAAQKTKNIEQIEEAAKEFEAVFIAEMIKPMFENISTDGPFGGGKGEEIFRGMMIQEYGKKLAETGQIGIADQVKLELIKAQEGLTTESVQDEQN